MAAPRPNDFAAIISYGRSELYHRGCPAIIVVELKVGVIKARDVGRLNSYMN